MKGVKLWIAQGFGVGRIPWAPGTFGSLLGLGWSLLLLSSGSFTVYCGGLVLGLAISVWLCGEAEQILGRKDPGSVVLDEISAIPACFLVWIAMRVQSVGHFPSPTDLLFHLHGVFFWLGFGFFRLFDIWKPVPVRNSQSLPGGWGVTVDDLLAAFYTAFALYVVSRVCGS